MRAAIPLLALVSFVQVHAQEAPSLLLVPRWKVGDARTMHISEVRSELKDGKATQKRSEIDLAVRVVNDDARHFILRMEAENVVLRDAQELSSKLGEDLTPWKKVTLRWSVSKTDGTAHLQNWTEARKFMRQSFDEVSKQLAKKDPTRGSIYVEMMTPVLELLDDSVGVESYFSDMVGYATFPYGKMLVLGDSLKFTGPIANPFGGTDTMMVQTTARLTALDPPAHTGEITVDQRMDLKVFKEMMKTMMMQMMGALATTPAELKQIEAKVNAELKTMYFDLTRRSVYTMDIRTTWPLHIESTSHVVAKSKGRTGEATVTSTVDFKN